MRRRQVSANDAGSREESVEIYPEKGRAKEISRIPQRVDPDAGYVDFAFPADLEVEVAVIPRHPCLQTCCTGFC